MSMTQNNTNPRNSKHRDAPEGEKRKKIKVPKKITESYLQNSGLYYLQRFASSVENFKTVMGRKIDNSCRYHKDQNRDECYKMLDALAVKFTELGLLDDNAYTRGMVTSLRRRGLSTRAIHAKLRAKGLNTELIKTTLHDYDSQYGEEDSTRAELRAALTCARKKRLQPFYDTKDVEKSLAALGRAGFSYDIAKKVIDMTPEDADEIIANYL